MSDCFWDLGEYRIGVRHNRMLWNYNFIDEAEVLN